MAKTIKQFFPCTPDNRTWEEINGELIIYYGQLNIPVTTEENWRETASMLSSSTAFSSYAIANPDYSPTWQDWVTDFATAVNGKTS